jgi:hypothetical protein
MHTCKLLEVGFEYVTEVDSKKSSGNASEDTYESEKIHMNDLNNIGTEDHEWLRLAKFSS